MAIVGRQFACPEKPYLACHTYHEQQVESAAEIAPCKTGGKECKIEVRQECAGGSDEYGDEDFGGGVAIFDGEGVAFHLSVALLVLHVFDGFANPGAEEGEECETAYPAVDLLIDVEVVEFA